MGNNQINKDISQKRIEKKERNEKNDLQEVNNSSISDADLLILGHSDTKYIKTEVIDKNHTCNKIFCPTFKKARQICENINVKKEPIKILLHCGTNDVDKRNVVEIIKDIDECLNTLLGKFKNSSIIISSVLPRKEAGLKTIVENINKYLYTITNRSNRVSFMDNKQITMNMLIDNKHINKTAFYIFLANIRFTMCGIMPKFNFKPRNDGIRNRYGSRLFKK